MSGAFTRSLRRELSFLARSPWDLAMVTWVPLLLMAIIAATLASGVVRRIPVAVVDQDRSASSRELVRLLGAAPGIRITARPASLDEAWAAARRAEVIAVVFIAEGTEREIRAGRQATITAHFNASYQTAGGIASREIGAAVGAFGARLAASTVALEKGPSAARAAAISARTTTLFNPQGSLEWNLVALIHPAILTLMLSLAVIAAVGREMRDGTAGHWLRRDRGRTGAAIAGKVAPYVLLFSLHGAAGLFWISAVRGWSIQGSVAALVAGQVLMYGAYASIGLLVLSLTKRMSAALSLAGLYAGAGLAFCGGIFPTDGAPLFTRIWSELLPLTAYVKLQGQQMYAGAPVAASLIPFAALAIGLLLPLAPALVLARRALLDESTWGLR